MLRLLAHLLPHVVDDGDREQDPGAAADGTKEVREHGKDANAATAEAAAVGMYESKTESKDCSRWPLKYICWSRSCLATSRGDCPDTSIQVFEKPAQHPSTKRT